MSENDPIIHTNLDVEGRWRRVALPVPEDNEFVERAEGDGRRIGFYPDRYGIMILLHDAALGSGNAEGDGVMSHTIPWSEIGQLEDCLRWLRAKGMGYR